MKVVISSKIPIFPAIGGNRVRILNMVEMLKQLGHEIDFIALPSRQMSNFDLKAHTACLGSGHVHVLRRTMTAEYLYNVRVAGRIVLDRIARIISKEVHKSDNVDYLFDKSVSRHFREICSKLAPDAAIIQYVHFSALAALLPIGTFSILDTHDSFEDEFTEGAETAGFARFDAILAIQDQEAARFAAMVAKAEARTEVHTISHALVLGDRLLSYKGANLAFVGSNFPANVACLNWFIDNVLPIVRGWFPEIKLFVSGSICRVIPEGPSIVRRGIVRDLQEAFVDAPILINPVVSGTGIKIKLLEAMGLGASCVSTEMGVRGMDNRFLSGVSIVPNNNADAFAGKIMELVRSENERAACGALNRAAAESWNDAIRIRLQALLNRAELNTRAAERS